MSTARSIASKRLPSPMNRQANAFRTSFRFDVVPGDAAACAVVSGENIAVMNDAENQMATALKIAKSSEQKNAPHKARR